MKIRFPLQFDLKTRDQSASKDSLVTNGFIEISPNKKRYTVKRPGMELEWLGLGSGDGIYFYDPTGNNGQTGQGTVYRWDVNTDPETPDSTPLDTLPTDGSGKVYGRGIVHILGSGFFTTAHLSSIAPIAIFAGGSNSTSTFISATSKYTIGVNTVVSGTALGTTKAYTGSCGNSTKGIIAGGGIIDGGAERATSDKYTYSGDVVTSGTSLGLARNSIAACATSSQGVFAGGGIGVSVPNTPATAYTDKYIFSGDTVGAGTALGLARTAICAAGNSTVGIFAGGATAGGFTGTTYVDKYTYSGDAVTAGTVLTAAKDYGLCAGSTVKGIFAGGVGASFIVSTTYVYTYANDTVSSGTALPAARTTGAGAGTNSVGVLTAGSFSGGSNRTATTVLYNLISDAVSNGTSIQNAVSALSGICSEPGGQ